MRAAGVHISTSESVIFELLGDSKHPKFKEVQPLIKTSAPDSGLLSKVWTLEGGFGLSEVGVVLITNYDNYNEYNSYTSLWLTRSVHFDFV